MENLTSLSTRKTRLGSKLRPAKQRVCLRKLAILLIGRSGTHVEPSNMRLRCGWKTGLIGGLRMAESTTYDMKIAFNILDGATKRVIETADLL